ncbi:ST3 beta-galactoside alpha-2,3-sialyltransferase 8 [Pholidichthys leucotaenia]
MIVRKKLCVALAIVAIVFLAIATQSIQSRNLLLLALPNSWNTSTDKGAVVKDAVLSAEQKPPLHPTMTEEEEKEEESIGNLGSCGCPDKCVSDLEESEWFSQRYDPEQQPILQQSGNNFDPDALSWWLTLQHSSNQNLQEVMSKMFQVISPPTMDFKPTATRCRSCAVVGNSGNLRQSGYGSLIDSHNYVIRMNKATTRQYEKDVGNRTTHHILYPESAVNMDPGVSLVLLPFKLRDMEWLTSALSTGHIKMTYMRVKERVEADKDKVLVVNPVFFKYVHDRWTEHHGRYPSTGMLALVFALHICDQVSVFGYGADSQGNWHHYWEVNRFAGAFRKTGVHSADFETGVIHQLAKEGKISLHLVPQTLKPSN